MRKRLRKQLIALGCVLTVVALLPLVFDQWLFPLPVERLTRPHGQFVYSADGTLINAYTSSDRFWRKPAPLDSISPRLIATVLACEDQWFYRHPGVNPVALISAAITNLRAGHVVRGGSTITMQIARMMEPKDRTIFNKLREIGRAFQLEWHYSKRELLDIYFNMVPYGGNIEGVGAASLLYFDKDADSLSWSECAVLAAIPVSPNAYRPDADLDACRARRNRILDRLLSLNVIDTADYRHALVEEIPSKRLDLPHAAPHFCQSLVERYPDSVTLHSTLDLETQALCNRLVERHHQTLRQEDINNLAVVVLDNATGDIQAMIGSPDFNDVRHHGQVNGALAPRSPGSALKPFVYALALDSGLLSPEYRIADIPINYGGYAPENYDEKFHGMVSMRQALINSYNVPAVRVCKEVGLDKFYELLKAGGLSTLTKPYNHYGLSLVLGSGEVTLLDLTSLYAGFARGGIPATAHWLVDDNVTDRTGVEKPLFSKETCYLISGILADLRRSDLPTSWQHTADMPTVAWKTGTSYGRRDAWAIGYTPRHTIGVWAGNFSGAGSIDIVGAEAAAPLMLDMFNELKHGAGHDWFERPAKVRTRLVCAASGRPPNDNCPATVIEEYIKGTSPLKTCTVHQMVLVDSATGKRTTRTVQIREPGVHLDKHVVAAWPPEVATWLAENGIEPERPTEVSSAEFTRHSGAPVITSPQPGAQFVLIDDVPAMYQKLLLKASVAAGSGRLHWFVDRELLQTCDAETGVFWVPRRGRHMLMCVDDAGRSATESFVVR